MRPLFAPWAALALLLSCAGPGRSLHDPRTFSSEPVDRRLVLLHVSDTESEVLEVAPGAGGLARFSSLVRGLLSTGEAPTLMLGAGDTFMPAPALQLEIDGVNAVSLANNRLGLQASALGNHEFDRGEGFLAEMVSRADFPYLTSTVDFDDGPVAPLALSIPDGAPSPWLIRHPGRILPRGKLCAGGELVEVEGELVCTGLVVGVIGATTETLAAVASTQPASRSVGTFEAVVARVQAQADALAAEGVDLVILLSHLQDVRREVELVAAGLSGVDVIVGGGGDDRLANPDHRLLHGEEPSPICEGERPCYPLVRLAQDGRPVLILATDGQLRYLGRVELTFDRQGVLTGYRGARPIPTDDRSLRELGLPLDAGGVELEARVRSLLEPLSTELATAAVYLDGERESVRNRQTNLGDLSADSIVWAARRHAPEGADRIAFGLRNGGGIRSSIGGVDHDTFVRGGGPIRLVDIEAALRFDNPVVLVTTTHRALKETFESTLRGVGTGRGHFPQVSREIFLAYDVDGQEQLQDLVAGPQAVRRAGDRVRTLIVQGPAGPVEIVSGGRLPTPDARITFATLDYLARGGDGYFPSTASLLEPIPLLDGGAPITEQSALRSYLAHLVGEGQWLAGRSYVDPAEGHPDSFTRIRALGR